MIVYIQQESLDLFCGLDQNFLFPHLENGDNWCLYLVLLY